jgi:MinD-like ATPase involved in chromosome partitioning or flagellar assembly
MNGHDEARRLRAKYANAPGELVDRPASAAPAFDDLPPPGAHPKAASPRPEWAPDLAAAPAEQTRARIGALEDTNRSARIGVRTEGPQQGWRAFVNRFGLNLAKGAAEIHYDKCVAQIQRTLRGPKTIAVLSGKGSGGKTTVTLNMGATMATHQRGLKIVAASIDPLGNIADRTRGVNSQPPRSVMSLAADPNLNRDSDVSSYLLTDKSGLRVLGASTADGAGFLTPEKLDRALSVLRDYFNITLIDFGLNIDSPVFHKGLAAADQLVLTAATTADSIDELHVLVNTLKRFGGKYIDLLHGAVVVFVQTRTGKTHVDVSAERTRIADAYSMPVIAIPFDTHIAEGGPMSLDLVDRTTQLPHVWLAAEVMSKLPD